MGTLHHFITKPNTALFHYRIVGTENFRVPPAMQRLLGRSWAANSEALRRTVSLTLQVCDHNGRKAAPVMVLAEPVQGGSRELFICPNPYPDAGNGNAWLVVGADGCAVFAARNLPLCRLFAAGLKTGFDAEPQTRPRNETHLSAQKDQRRRRHA